MSQLSDIYRQIGRQYTLNFVSAKSSTKQSRVLPNCKKGWACGYSCQSKEKKNCPSALSGQAKTYAEWLSSQAERKSEPRVKTGAIEAARPINAKAKTAEPPINISDHKSLLSAGEAFASRYALDKELATSSEEQKLKKRIDELKDRVRNYEATPEERKEFQKIFTKWKSLESKRQSKLEAKAEKLLNNLYNRSKLSQSDAEVLANRTDIQLADWPDSDRRKLREDIAAFHRLTNGNVKSLDKIIHDDNRAYASYYSNEINIGSPRDRNDARRIAFHEIGHFLESTLSVAGASRDWLNSKSLGVPISLNNLTKSSGYKDDEDALPGEFISAYVGKIYGPRGDPTEVVSVGLEYFRNKENLSILFKRDKSHFYFTLGVILYAQNRS